MNRLEEYRKEIDQWDQKLVEIFEKRMEVVLKVLDYKREHGLPIFHEGREQEILDKIMNNVQNKRVEKEVEELYKQIMRISRQFQSKKLFPYNIVLVGFMGSGKSTIGKKLSHQLEMAYYDTDQLIEERMGMTVGTIFEKYGEAYFREVERNIVKELGEEPNRIISCGGGVVLDEKNVDGLKRKGKIILLRTQVETIYDRLKEDTSRPLLKNHMNKEYIESLLEKRKSYYQAAADIIVSTDQKDIEEISKEIIIKLLS